MKYCLYLSAASVLMIAPAVRAAESKSFHGEWVRSGGVSDVTTLKLKQSGNRVTGTSITEGFHRSESKINCRITGDKAVGKATIPSDFTQSGADAVSQLTMRMLPQGKLSYSDPGAGTVTFVRRRAGTENPGSVDIGVKTENGFKFNDGITEDQKRPWFSVVPSGGNRFDLVAGKVDAKSDPPKVFPLTSIFVLRGVPNCKAGAIPHAVTIDQKPLMKKPVIVKYGVRPYQIVRKSNGDVLLSDGTREQLICQCEKNEESPNVIWAGDLDRDGSMDFLLDVGNHAGWMEPPSIVLLLSTENAEIAGMSAKCATGAVQ